MKNYATINLFSNFPFQIQKRWIFYYERGSLCFVCIKSSITFSVVCRSNTFVVSMFHANDTSPLLIYVKKPDWINGLWLCVSDWLGTCKSYSSQCRIIKHLSFQCNELIQDFSVKICAMEEEYASFTILRNY